MTVYTVDPLTDQRWHALVARHPQASAFHRTEWLAALKRTYGYRPVAFTTSAPGRDLEDGVVFCEVRSWLTGRRLVSLPFADHCEPLVERGDALSAIGRHLERIQRTEGWKYIEVRPQTRRFDAVGATESMRFWVHALDLRPPADALFGTLHKDSTRRKIQRATREGLTCRDGRSDSLLLAFYDLLVKTRHRHHVPPQPLAWFRNLAGSFGEALQVSVAYHGNRPVAAVLTLRHGQTTVYKYGASDDAFHPLGGMHLLLWNAIEAARAAGCMMFDLGRCDTDNPGLATFKERWGAVRSEIAYWRFGATAQPTGALRRYATNGARQLLDHAPGICRVAAGRFLYRHAG